MTTAPLLSTYTGVGFDLVGRSKKDADAAYVIGARYYLDPPRQERSRASHNHFFAAVAEAWANLPEAIAPRFATDKHLRKYALIQTGYRNDTTAVCASNDEALKLAAFITALDEFAIVVVDGSSVHVARAKSQDTKSMGKKTFQASKDAVLSYIAWMIEVPTTDLSDFAGQIA